MSSCLGLNLGKAAVLFLPALSLSGCSLFETPYALSLTDIDESGPQRPAVITISNPQVYARETLINDRREEVEFLEALLRDSKTKQFEPQLSRDLRSLTALRTELGLAFDPLKGKNTERQEALNDLVFERDKLKLQQDILVEQRRFEKMKSEDFDVQPRTSSDASNSFASAGGSPAVSDASAALTELGGFAEKIRGEGISRGEGPDKSEIKQAPIDHFRDLQAYRAELRAALAAVNLDDLHDFGGNTLYRLQFDVMVAPGENKNKFGVANLILKPPQVDKEQVRELYLRWISAFTKRINDDLKEKETESKFNVYADIAKLIGLELARPLRSDASVVVLSLPRSSQFQLPAEVFVNPGEAFADPKDKDLRRCFRGEDIGLECLTNFSAANFAGPGGGQFLQFLSALSEEIERDTSRGSPYATPQVIGLSPDEIPDALRSGQFLNEFSQRIDLHDACGIPETARFGTLLETHMKYWGLRLEDREQIKSMPDYQFGMHAFLEDMALAAIGVHKASIIISAAMKGVEGLEVSADRPFMDEINKRAEQYLLLIIQLAPPSKKTGCAEHIGRRLSVIPQDFIDRILATPSCYHKEQECTVAGDAFAYGTTPVELAHRTSTISSAARSMEMALAATASLAQAGAAADLNMAFMRASSGNVEALERQPVVVGYADRHAVIDGSVHKYLPSFGWVFGPTPRIDAKENEIVLEHTLSRHNVTADISVPAWWPNVELEYGAAWIANWGGDQLIEMGRQHKSLIDVDLPMNESDLDMLTTHLASAALPGSGIEVSNTNISSVWPDKVSACTGDITFLIEGRNVWRSSAVYLGGIKARNITVLPDMKGIAASVNIGQLFSGWFSRLEPLEAHPKSNRARHGGDSEAATAGSQVPVVAEPPLEVIYTLIDRDVTGAESVDLIVWTRNGYATQPIKLSGGPEGESIDCFSRGFVTAPRTEKAQTP